MSEFAFGQRVTFLVNDDPPDIAEGVIVAILYLHSEIILSIKSFGPHIYIRYADEVTLGGLTRESGSLYALPK